MRKTLRVAGTIFFLPMMIGANQTSAQEKVYVVQNQEVEFLSIASAYEEVLEHCDFALATGNDPKFPAFTTVYSVRRADLYAIQTQSAQGKVVNDSVRKVGESIACVGDMTTAVSPIPPVYIGAQEFPTGPYSSNVNQVLKIELNGNTYYVNGSARFRTDPSVGGVPHPGFFLIAGTGTLHRLVEGGYEVLGSYTSNIALPLPGYPTTEDSGGVVVLRISESGYVVPPIGG